MIIITCYFIAVETLGVFNASARHLLADLGRRISINTVEARETTYLHRVSKNLCQCYFLNNSVKHWPI